MPKLPFEDEAEDLLDRLDGAGYLPRGTSYGGAFALIRQYLKEE